MGVPCPVEQSFLTNQQKVLKKKNVWLLFSFQLELGFKIDPFLISCEFWHIFQCKMTDFKFMVKFTFSKKAQKSWENPLTMGVPQFSIGIGV